MKDLESIKVLIAGYGPRLERISHTRNNGAVSSQYTEFYRKATQFHIYRPNTSIVVYL